MSISSILVKNKENFLLWIALFLYFLLLMNAAVVNVHIFGNDEQARLLVVRYIFHLNRLPIGNESAVRIPLWGFSYAMEPYFPSLVAVFWIKVLFLFEKGNKLFIIGGRIGSVLAACGVGFLSWKIAQLQFNKKSSQYLFISLSIFLPEVMILGSYLNNDIMSLLASYLITFALLLGMKKNWDWPTCILLAVGLSIGAVSYYFAYGFIIFGLASFIIFNVKKRTFSKRFVIKVLLIIVLILILTSWFFVRNWLHFHDVLGLKTVSLYSERFGSINPPLKPSIRPTPAHVHESLFQMISGFKFQKIPKATGWLYLSALSFVGTWFNHAHLLMPSVIYDVYGVVLTSGFLGGIFLTIRNWHTLSFEMKLFRIGLLLTMVSAFSCSLYYSYFVDYEPAGRYIISILLPLMYFVTVGFDWLSRKVMLSGIMITFCFLVAMWSYFYYLI